MLTELAIKALKPRSIRYYVSDAHGLALEVFPSGSMAWRYRYSLNGRPEKIALGRYPQISLKAARQKRDKLAVSVANGRSPAKQKQVAKAGLSSRTTMREFGERYYRERIEKDRKDPAHLRRYLDKEIFPALGTKALNEITAADVQAIVFRKRDHGFPAAAAQIRNLIKRIFDYAIVCQIVQTNPALATPMRFITRARTRTRALSPEEISVYLRTLYQANIRRQFKLALHIILLTLVRKSELLYAKWKDIDFDSGEWSIPPENSKTEQPHIVYMSRQVMDLFEELKVLASDSEWVLPGRSSLLRPFAKNAMNKALEGVNFHIPPFTIHDLRRTGSTRLHEMGFPSDVIEKTLNHTIGGIRGVYNRAEYANQRKQMLQCWADCLDEWLENKRASCAKLSTSRTAERKSKWED